MLGVKHTCSLSARRKRSDSMARTVFAEILKESEKRIKRKIREEMRKRSREASRELKTAAQIVLRGERSGRRYKGYTASAPGEPPAARTGKFASSWRVAPRKLKPGIANRNLPYLARWLEKGTMKRGLSKPARLKRRRGRNRKGMAPRPFTDKIKQTAWPKILQIYRRAYL